MKTNYHYPYVAFLPAGYNEPTDQKKYPAILFLHGAGGVKNAPTALAVNGEAPSALKALADKYQAIIICPVTYGSWDVSEVETAWNHACSTYAIDPDRAIITGLSLGGGGTLKYITSSLERAGMFVAAIAICPVQWGTNFKHVADAKLPVWFIHAQNDTTVNVSSTTNQVAKLLSYKPEVPPVMNILPSGGHGIWNGVYSDRQLWDLVFSLLKPVEIEPLPEEEEPDTQIPDEPVEVEPVAVIYFHRNDIEFRLPAHSTVLNASASENVKSYSWECIKQPTGSVVDIRQKTSSETQVRWMYAPGNYEFMLTVIGTDGLSVSKVLNVKVQAPK